MLLQECFANNIHYKTFLHVHTHEQHKTLFCCIWCIDSDEVCTESEAKPNIVSLILEVLGCAAPR